ncbi:MAG: hypothetical protein HQ582_06170 [Planctomycetes bacterium]|nr:hypothetical protein [Planctomycetota bacterium]
MCNESAGGRWLSVGIIAALVLGISVAGFFLQFGARHARQLTLDPWDFRLVVCGLMEYANSKGRLPDAFPTDSDGNSLGSWRFQIVGYLEAMEDVPFDTDLPPNAPENIGFTAGPHGVYCLGAAAKGESRGDTRIFAITGPGTAFDPAEHHTFEDFDEDLVLLIEVYESQTHWSAPGDYDIDQLPEFFHVPDNIAGIHVAFADAGVWLLRSDVPCAIVKKLCTIEGAREHDRDSVLGPYVIQKMP